MQVLSQPRLHSENQSFKRKSVFRFILEESRCLYVSKGFIFAIIEFIELISYNLFLFCGLHGQCIFVMNHM